MDLMAVIVFWVLCAIFSAMLANGKGRDGAGWFFVGLFFGPFGLLVAALPPLEAKSESGEDSSLSSVESGDMPAQVQALRHNRGVDPMPPPTEAEAAPADTTADSPTASTNEDDRLAMFAAAAFQAILTAELIRDPEKHRTGEDYENLAVDAWIRAQTLRDARTKVIS